MDYMKEFYKFMGEQLKECNDKEECCKTKCQEKNELSREDYLVDVTDNEVVITGIIDRENLLGLTNVFSKFKITFTDLEIIGLKNG